MVKLQFLNSNVFNCHLLYKIYQGLHENLVSQNILYTCYHCSSFIMDIEGVQVLIGLLPLGALCE